MSNRLASNALTTASKLRHTTAVRPHTRAQTPAPSIHLSCRLSSSEAASTDDSPSQPDHDDMSYGTVYKYDSIKKFGFILPEGLNRPHTQKDLLFFHCTDILSPLQNPKHQKAFHPHLKPSTRIQYKSIKAPRGKSTSMVATQITLPDGRYIPPFGKYHLDQYIKVKKAQMGDRVYEIMDNVEMNAAANDADDGTSTGSSDDVDDMERGIVKAFEDCCRQIEGMKSMVRTIENIYHHERERDG